MQSLKKTGGQAKERKGAVGTFIERDVIWINQLPKTKQIK